MGKIVIKETANEPEKAEKDVSKAREVEKNDEPVIVPIDVDAKSGAVSISDESVKKSETDEEKLVEVEAKSEESAKADDQEEAAEKIDTAVITTVEAERISESADAFAQTEEVAVKEVEKISSKSATKTKTKKKTEKKPAGMVMDFRPANQKAAASSETENPAQTDDEDAEAKAHRAPASKPKAILMAAATALVVGVIGGFVIWLTGRHEPSSCLVQFEPNGGSEVAEQTVVCGTVIERPEDPTKDGFEFLGWLYNGEVFDFYSMKASDGMILKARWQAQENVEFVTVAFDTDGGSEVDRIEVKKGGRIKTPPITKRAGYRFVGWYLDTGNKLTKFDFNKTINEDMVLEAMWAEVPKEEQKPTPEQPTKPTDVAVTEIEAPNQTLELGQRVDMPVTIKPKEAKAEISVTMSNDSRAVADCAGSLNGDGTLTCWAVAPGEARVMITDMKSGILGVFKITVLPILVESVSISGAPVEAIEIEASVQLTAKVMPENATDRHVTWTSSAPEVVEVSSDGKLTAKVAGTATITATAGGKSTTVTVNVKAKPAEPKPVTGVAISGENKVEVGKTVQLTATVSPSDADNTTVVWSSSDSDFAEVDANGLVTAKAVGNVTITATVDGQSATVEITVEAASVEGGLEEGEV